MSQKPHLLISTPTYGNPSTASVSWGYAHALSLLAAAPDVEVLHPVLAMSSDLVRVRSRALRIFAEAEKATHLLFWDEDVIPRDLGLIGVMIGTGLDFVTLPYPRKVIRWDNVSLAVRDEAEQAAAGRQNDTDLEAASVEWPLRVISPALKTATAPGGKEWHLAKVSECGLGFTMVSKRVAVKMIEYYTTHHPELVFDDEINGNFYPTVAMFQLMMRQVDKKRVLCSEDYSFCYRWRDLGEDIWMLGDTASHIGRYRFGSTFR